MNTFKEILITGGAGYVGSRLVPQLLEKNYKITVYDSLFFGSDFLPKNDPNLRIIKGDIRDIELFKSHLKGIDVVLHLACISNDASFELDENLSKSINFDAFEGLVKHAKKEGVKRFVYCSSSSVYGVSKEREVKEDHPLVPLTQYNKFKGMCEPILWKYNSENFECVTIRPATIMGYAPRQRFDLSVNILTNHAVNNNKITVFGGEQLRPNLHIQDMCDAYELLIKTPGKKINGETFNIGHQNYSIMQIAKIVKDVVEKEFPEKGTIGISTTTTDDIRSYHINSEKIFKALAFKPQFSIQDAVKDLCNAFRKNKLPDSLNKNIYFNVKRLKELKIS